MKKFLSLTALTIILSTSFNAKAEEAICKEGVTANVNGLVCDFCARALEKVFSKRDEFDSLNINLDEGLVNISFADGKTMDNETITKLITDSGYNVVSLSPKTCS
jgi:copper chaperone CopZ